MQIDFVSGTDWITTAGGPLICLPSKVLPSWNGALNDDYDDLCRRFEDREEWLNSFKLKGQQGFYFHDSCETAWFQVRNAVGCIVRVVGAEQDWELPTSVAFDGLKESQPRSVLYNEDKNYVLFDAAVSGRDSNKKGLILTIPLGNIEIRTLIEETDDTTIVFHLFTFCV